MGMKIFLDTEFIAGFHKPLLGKKRHFIDLISIGLVDDKGREYYAISKDFNPSDADEWVKKNVFEPITTEFVKCFHGDRRNEILDVMSGKSIVGRMNVVQDWIGKTNKQIARDIRGFVYGPAVAEGDGMDGADADIEWWLKENAIEFYGYYADYDWVLFCSLFGRMIDLPQGFPMYCMDLKQMMQDRGLSKEWKQSICPDPEGEHNALVDAKWNQKLHGLIVDSKAVPA
jgi:hypothetical protein